MLKYVAHKNLKTADTGECNRIVVYGANGDPVSFVVQVGEDQYIAASIGDKIFKDLLDKLNIEKLNIVK